MVAFLKEFKEMLQIFKELTNFSLVDFDIFKITKMIALSQFLIQIKLILFTI